METMKINAVVDVSGSMGSDIELIKAKIAEFLNEGIEVNLVLCSISVLFAKTIKKVEEMNDISFTSAGGTILQTGIDYLILNKMESYPTFIFSDGYCDVLDYTKFDKTFTHCKVGGDYSQDIPVKKRKTVKHETIIL